MDNHTLVILSPDWLPWKYQVNRWLNGKSTGWSNFETSEECQSYIFNSHVAGYISGKDASYMQQQLKGN